MNAVNLTANAVIENPYYGMDESTVHEVHLFNMNDATKHSSAVQTTDNPYYGKF